MRCHSSCYISLSSKGPESGPESGHLLSCLPEKPASRAADPVAQHAAAILENGHAGIAVDDLV